jgi:hypothetical protein
MNSSIYEFPPLRKQQSKRVKKISENSFS